MTPPFPLTIFLFVRDVLLYVHDFSSSFIVSPLRSSFPPLRSSFLLFVHHFSSSCINFSSLFIIFLCDSSTFLFGQVPPGTSAGFWVSSPFARQSNLTPPFPLTFFLFVHHFSSSFIISPLSSFIVSPFHSSFLLFVHHFSSSFIISPLRSSFLLFAHHHFSSSFIISPLRSSFLLFVHHFSSAFIISPLPSSFLLFVHHFSSSFMILLFVHHVSSSYIFCPLRSSFFFAFINFPLRSSAAGHVGRALGDFSFCTSIKFDTAVSAYSFPLRS